jgi:NAD dependent epimerase/dehydratase family enzyme
VTGQRVLPKRALGLGYSFQYPTLETALVQILAD